MFKFDVSKLEWTREPESFSISEEKIEIVTKPHSDLWQRTYYHFRNDNAPVLQMKTDEKFFSFIVKTEFESKHRFDQCGVVMYLDSDNWIKGSIEYENEEFFKAMVKRITVMPDHCYRWYRNIGSGKGWGIFSEKNYELYDYFTISFEQARRFRKRTNNYVRENQYNPIKVEIYIRTK